MNRLKARQVRMVVIGAAAVNDIDYVVPLGTALVITNAQGQHNDVANRTALWAVNFNDGAGFRNVCQPISLAAYSRLELYVANALRSWSQPLILRGGMTIRFNCAGLVGAAIAYIDILADEYLGETPYVG
jgi:hypothetical protein